VGADLRYTNSSPFFTSCAVGRQPPRVGQHRIPMSMPGSQLVNCFDDWTAPAGVNHRLGLRRAGLAVAIAMTADDLDRADDAEHENDPRPRRRAPTEVPNKAVTSVRFRSSIGVTRKGRANGSHPNGPRVAEILLFLPALVKPASDTSSALVSQGAGRWAVLHRPRGLSGGRGNRRSQVVQLSRSFRPTRAS
jgi:hypothetical protein